MTQTQLKPEQLARKFIKDDSLHTEYEDPDVILENIKESEWKILEQIDKITSVL